MSAIKVTPLDMSAIQALTNNLYALNNSDLGRTKAKGVVHLLVNDASGQEVQINVPKTWIPVNLGEYCDVSSITKASRFRELVRKGILVIISDKEANDLLDSQKGREEAAKVRENDNKVASAIRRSFAATDARVVQSNSPEAATGGPPPIGGVATKEIVINPKIRALVDAYNGGASDEESANATRDIHGDKDSWIWASQQIADTSSQIYQALSDKISDFDDEATGLGHDSTPAAPAAPSGTFTINT